MILSHQQFAFFGYIANKEALIHTLNLEGTVTTHALVLAAYQKWGMRLNQEVAGDYCLVLPLTQEGEYSSSACFICCSAFSSWRLFYQNLGQELHLSRQIQAFMVNASFDKNAIATLFYQSYIAPPFTLVAGVGQLATGESQLWLRKAEEAWHCVEQTHLSLWQKLAVPSGDAISIQAFHEAANAECNTDEQLTDGQLTDEKGKGMHGAGLSAGQRFQITQLGEVFEPFQALPLLADLQQSPVCQWQDLALFHDVLQQEGRYHSVTGLAAAMAGLDELDAKAKAETKGHQASFVAQKNQAFEQVQEDEFKSYVRSFKPVFRRDLRQSLKRIKKQQRILRQQYQDDMLAFGEKGISFELWQALTLVLPQRWCQERDLATALGYEVRFPLLEEAVLTKVLLGEWDQTHLNAWQASWQQNESKAGFDTFSLEDDSLINVYDAMQRLMGFGYPPITQALLHLAPPMTAKLINNERARSRVTAFCMKVLTLDYLTRHWQCDLAREGKEVLQPD